MSQNAEHKYDVFISYSHKDARWVFKRLVPRLTGAGLKVHTDKDFLFGGPVLTNIEKAVNDSRHMLLVLTQNYLKSEWTTFETLLAGTGDPAGLRRKIIPLLLESCPLPLRIAALTHADFTERKKHSEMLGLLIRQIKLDTNSESEVVDSDKVGWFHRNRIAVAILLSLFVIVIGIAITYFVLKGASSIPPLSGDFIETFNAFSKSDWVLPCEQCPRKSCEECFIRDDRLSVSKVSSPISPAKGVWQDFQMQFQLKLVNASGAAWAIRMRSPKDYLLFYLWAKDEEPSDGLTKCKGFYVYAVRNGKLDSSKRTYFPLDNDLEFIAGREYDVCIAVQKNIVKHYIRPSFFSTSRRGTGVRTSLGQYTITDDFYSYGGIGFRTVRSEEFFIDELYVRPPKPGAPWEPCPERLVLPASP